MDGLKRAWATIGNMLNFKSLAQFYTSNEWRKFREIVIAERINPKDGILYDEYNGHPLLKSYDIILHHKIELNMQNVNDRSISLNSDNIMIVSMKSHNEIHNRFGGRIKAYQRKVYYVYGAPCSGKSTYVRDNMQSGDLVFDIDKIWEALSGQPEYIKPATLKDVVFNVRNAVYDSIKTRTGLWQNAYVIEGGALLGDRIRRLETLGAEPIYIDTSKDECINRLLSDKNRATVQDQWIDYINKWFNDYQE